MLRRLALILVTISIVFIPLFFAPKTLAADWKVGDPIGTFDQLDAAMQSNSSLDKNLQDFCKKRQGNQMNLETWYSGKCTDDTFSGEGVGFSDIVILDLAEKLIGKKDPGNTFSGTLEKIFGIFKDQVSDTSPKEQQLALEAARQQLFYGQNNGLLGQSGKMIGMLIQNQPASTGTYLAYVTQNLQKHKVIPSALAAPISQGVGFATLSPFLTIWAVFRNLAYLGLVVFFIVYGFMMMFRVNLGQKTVISVQLAIPKLIITLLIITFSYAIVGLIYDLMWVVIAFAFGYLETQGIIVSIPKIWNPAQFASGNSWAGMMGSLFLNMIIAGPAAIFGVLNLIMGGVGATIGTIVGFLYGVNGIISLIIIIAVIISYGKLFFKLVGAFISVVIALITGPLVLLGNAFPGSQVIGTWIRGIVANLSVFPITMLLLFFSYLLMIQPIVGICYKTTSLFDTFTAKFIKPPDWYTRRCEYIFGVKSLVPADNSGIYGIPLIHPQVLGVIDVGYNAQGLLALLGVGLLLMASKYVDIVRDALKVPPFKYGADIGGALKAARGMYGEGKKAITEVAAARNPGSQAPASNTNQSQQGSTIPSPIPGTQVNQPNSPPAATNPP